MKKKGKAVHIANFPSIKTYSKILVLGLSYKKNVDDLRESPSLKIIDILNQMGANVQFSDPFFKNVSRKYLSDGTRSFFASMYPAILIAVGNVSLELWPKLM